MTPAPFLAWRLRLGFDKKHAAAALGCSRNAIMHWENGVNRQGKPSKIPRYVALACAAIAHGLPPID